MPDATSSLMRAAIPIALIGIVAVVYVLYTDGRPVDGPGDPREALREAASPRPAPTTVRPGVKTAESAGPVGDERSPGVDARDVEPTASGARIRGSVVSRVGDGRVPIAGATTPGRRAVVIEGDVVDEVGAPVPNAVVAMRRGLLRSARFGTGATRRGLRARCDGRGRFTLSALQAGVVSTVFAHAPGFVASASEEFVVRPGGSRVRIVLRRGGTIVGTVRETGGLPRQLLAASRVLPRSNPATGFSRCLTPIGRTASDPVVIRPGPNGTITVELRRSATLSKSRS